MIIGREREKQELLNTKKKNSSQLVIVYGRRRVGKTFLVNETFNNDFAFKLTGDYKKPLSVQLSNFNDELKNRWKKDFPKPKSWREAFRLLMNYIDSLEVGKKQVVFFDEMPWMDTPKSKFIDSFEWFWNQYGSSKNNLIFVVCGSASGWMVKKFDKNKGGLFDRQTLRIYLNPFNLYETREFLLSNGIDWSIRDICECYMIMGGIPFYLNLLDPSLTLNENIDNMFFKKRCLLWDEFDKLYSTLFNDDPNYVKLVETLSKKKSGLTRKELVEDYKYVDNGNLTTILKNLLDTGFIKTTNCVGSRKTILYQLSDYYTLFYFKYIKDNYGINEHFYRNSTSGASRRIWNGFAFELVCFDHINQIKQKLGISGIISKDYSYYVKGNDEEKGTQIDLIINRKDHVSSLCEIKFYDSEFIIDKECYEDLINKRETYLRHSGTRNSIQMVMITSYGLANSKYNNLINRNIKLEDMFIPND